MSCIYNTPLGVIDQMIIQPYEMFLVYAPKLLEVQEIHHSRGYWTHAVFVHKNNYVVLFTPCVGKRFYKTISFTSRVQHIPFFLHLMTTSGVLLTLLPV